MIDDLLIGGLVLCVGVGLVIEYKYSLVIPFVKKYF